MKLLTKAIRDTIPKLHEQEDKGDEAIIHVRFFDPTGSWTWYATEGEPVLDENGEEIDFMFFGLVHGDDKEWGYFNLSQLKEVKGRFGLGIGRDMYCGKKTIGEMKNDGEVVVAVEQGAKL